MAFSHDCLAFLLPHALIHMIGTISLTDVSPYNLIKPSIVIALITQSREQKESIPEIEDKQHQSSGCLGSFQLWYRSCYVIMQDKCYYQA